MPITTFLPEQRNTFAEFQRAVQSQQTAALGGLGTFSGLGLLGSPFGGALCPTFETTVVGDSSTEKSFYAKLKAEIAEWLKIEI